MDEFALIREVVQQLGDRADGPWINLGPGDDAAVIDQTPGHQLVSSIDTLVADVHFPAQASAVLIGYRSIMVSVSDLAAMGASPRYVLVSLTLPSPDASWVRSLARGMAEAATVCDTYVCGGNFAKGALNIAVSVHGELPAGSAVTRAGANPGDTLYVSGPLGGAAACVRQTAFSKTEVLSGMQQRYFKPRARTDLVEQLREQASAAIDVSDGLLADVAHLCAASNVGAHIVSQCVPVHPDAQLQDALTGGDDYELLVASPSEMPGMIAIGHIEEGEAIYLDDQLVSAQGYNHFGP